MSIEVTFTMERPNTTTDFWWESTDPQIVDICHKIDTLAESFSITRTSSKSENGLVFTSQFVTTIDGSWQQFMNAILSEMPTMIATRNAYLEAAGHTIRMVINHIETNSIIKETATPTWSLAN